MDMDSKNSIYIQQTKFGCQKMNVNIQDEGEIEGQENLLNYITLFYKDLFGHSKEKYHCSKHGRHFHSDTGT